MKPAQGFVDSMATGVQVQIVIGNRPCRVLPVGIPGGAQEFKIGMPMSGQRGFRVYVTALHDVFLKGRFQGEWISDWNSSSSRILIPQGLTVMLTTDTKNRSFKTPAQECYIELETFSPNGVRRGTVLIEWARPERMTLQQGQIYVPPKVFVPTGGAELVLARLKMSNSMADPVTTLPSDAAVERVLARARRRWDWT